MNFTTNNKKLPLAFRVFLEGGLIKFQPWELLSAKNDYIDERFSQECPNRKVLTIATLTTDDTYAGFEIIDDIITDKVLVYHLTFQKPDKDWNIIETTYDNFWTFMKSEVLPAMRAWA